PPPPVQPHSPARRSSDLVSVSPQRGREEHQADGTGLHLAEPLCAKHGLPPRPIPFGSPGEVRKGSETGLVEPVQEQLQIARKRIDRKSTRLNSSHVKISY